MKAKDMGENGCFVFADCGLNQNPNPEQLAESLQAQLRHLNS